MTSTDLDKTAKTVMASVNYLNYHAEIYYIGDLGSGYSYIYEAWVTDRDQAAKIKAVYEAQNPGREFWMTLDDPEWDEKMAAYYYNEGMTLDEAGAELLDDLKDMIALYEAI